ncbi:3-Oxoacyl-(acyl carrier protein) synthase II [Desulfatibacillum aliphaticivorans]|uniref:3-oxoacyl-[acyl-carrier-protein] synthase 1 n=1 Tax=Desulfatibacillum aliphaticivorans TaxID=218208 RepID=B8FFP2_DESAL|nr:beta-ketoacyl-[acyl-carrier-protein] synthase family protein [Desulfatibacillum aliphaticivorans]ACL03447.1 3-Oxoacyl-(acyl carrier protein) synthase II [Desulfatibacillum aliphaticivorans]
MDSRGVVITGLGVISPIGNGIAEFMDALKRGKPGVRFIPELEELKFSCCIAGVPQDFAQIREKYFTVREASVMTEATAYAAVAALEAWKDAGLEIPNEESPVDWDTGAVIGTGIGDMETIAQRIVPMVNDKKVRRMGSRIVEQVMNSGASAKVSGLLGLGAQATANSSACSTGTEAVAEAVWKIRAGLAKRMVVGGTEGPSPYTWSGFDAMKVLPRKFNDRPETASRPMSAAAAGFVPGAGAGILILEDEQTALERGARIYAKVSGVHVNCGGQRNGGAMTAPNNQGVLRCIHGALKDAGVQAKDIDSISGHLTATFADPIEVQNWAKALGASPGDFPLINSVKSMTGHCLGAAGAVESIAAALELHHGFLHPSINCEDIHPEIAPFEEKVVRKYTDYPELQCLAKASFGFGDVNSCLVFTKWKA